LLASSAERGAAHIAQHRRVTRKRSCTKHRERGGSVRVVLIDVAGVMPALSQGLLRGHAALVMLGAC
jgi:hypothetical protein